MLGRSGPVGLPTAAAVALARSYGAVGRLRSHPSDLNASTVRHLARTGTYSIVKAPHIAVSAGRRPYLEKRAPALAVLMCLAFCWGSGAVASAAVVIGAQQVTVSGPGATAVITRSPYNLSVLDASGRRVLGEVANPGAVPLPVPPVPQTALSANNLTAPSLYAPLTFLVGGQQTVPAPAAQFEGNLLASEQTGIEYSAQSVLSARAQGSGVALVLTTDDPSGRQLNVTVTPGSSGTIHVSARPSNPAGVVQMGDSFSSMPNEAFHGFGGRHNSLDQHGQSFFNYLQQENVGAGGLQPLVNATDTSGNGQSSQFPNGPTAAYYVYSSFLSNLGYGFLLDRSELSQWRLDSDHPNAWQASVMAAGIDYDIAPGSLAQSAATISAISGRQRVPPSWAGGSLLDREVSYPSDSAAHYLSQVQADIANIRRYHLPLTGYRIEGWRFLSPAQLSAVIGQLKALGVHPMLYFRAFVGRDQIGTDDPGDFDYAIQHGYVATTAAGTPYTFPTNFQSLGALIDFTNPAAVTWWQSRIRAALDTRADGFMQDFGEQVLPDMHFHDGETGATMHNQYPVLFHQATRQAIDQYAHQHPDRHIFFFSRSGYSGRDTQPGSASYENANFPGDETTDFSPASGLASQTPDMLNRAIGGAYGFGTDIGGYFDLGPYQPTSKELFIRWAEWAALSPVFRLHGSVGAGTHVPWSYDQQTVDLYNQLAQLHLAARPLILSLWAQADQTGIPPTRPLYLAYPNDPQAARQDQEWLLGPNVLVAPIVTQGATSRTVYFPRGCWRNPGGGPSIHGPLSQTVAAALPTLPYYFRCATRPFSPPGTGSASGAACTSGGRLTVPVGQSHGRVTRVRVYLNGRLVTTLYARRVTRVLVTPPGHSRATLRIVEDTANHSQVTAISILRGCRATSLHTTVRQTRATRPPFAG